LYAMIFPATKNDFLGI